MFGSTEWSQSFCGPTSHRCAPLSVDIVDFSPVLTNDHVAVDKEPHTNSDSPHTSDSSDPKYGWLPLIARDNQRRLLNNQLLLIIIPLHKHQHLLRIHLFY